MSQSSETPATAEAEAGPKSDTGKSKVYDVYEPDLREKVVEFMGQGYSLTAFAGSIGASREMVKAWMAENPEFAAAGERARAARTRFLEKQFLDGGTGAKVAAHVFALKNAAPEDWRDRPEAEGSKPESVVVEVPGNGRD